MELELVSTISLMFVRCYTIIWAWKLDSICVHVAALCIHLENSMEFVKRLARDFEIETSSVNKADSHVNFRGLF
jgi:hypothetical protein